MTVASHASEQEIHTVAGAHLLTSKSFYKLLVHKKKKIIGNISAKFLDIFVLSWLI